MKLFTFPNALTCCNLVCGCMATGAAFHSHFTWALALIIAGAVFDFFDGLAARALGISSEIGKELDSLADIVTFGVAPSAMLFQLFGLVVYPSWLAPAASWLPYTSFLMAAFSALRLAKFNLDTRQSVSFIGLPTPANALFWSSLIVAELPWLASPRFNAVWLFLFMLASCFLLTSELPLFALKFKNFKWADNRIKYIFLCGAVLLLVAGVLTPLGLTAVPLVILWYLLLSILAYTFKL